MIGPAQKPIASGFPPGATTLRQVDDRSGYHTGLPGRFEASIGRNFQRNLAEAEPAPMTNRLLGDLSALIADDLRTLAGVQSVTVTADDGYCSSADSSCAALTRPPTTRRLLLSWDLNRTTRMVLVRRIQKKSCAFGKRA